MNIVAKIFLALIIWPHMHGMEQSKPKPMQKEASPSVTTSASQPEEHQKNHPHFVDVRLDDQKNYAAVHATANKKTVKTTHLPKTDKEVECDPWDLSGHSQN